MRHQRYHDTFQVTHILCHILGDEFNHIVGNRKAVGQYFVLQNLFAELLVGTLQLGGKSLSKTGKQALFHSLHIHGCTIGGHHQLFIILMQVIEYMKEGVLRFFQPR